MFGLILKILIGIFLIYISISESSWLSGFIGMCLFGISAYEMYVILSGKPEMTVHSKKSDT
jgi:hypothetical protein